MKKQTLILLASLLLILCACQRQPVQTPLEQLPTQIELPAAPKQADMEAEQNPAEPEPAAGSDDPAWHSRDEREQFLLDSGVFLPMPDGTFGAGEPVSRAALCEALSRMLGIETDDARLAAAFGNAECPADSDVTVPEAVAVLMRLSGYDDAFVNECSGYPHERYMDRHGERPYNDLYFAHTHFEVWLAIEYGREGLETVPCNRKTLLKLLAFCFLDNPLPGDFHDQTPRTLLGGQFPTPDRRDFVVENGVLTDYLGPTDVELVIPEDLGITRIAADFLHTNYIVIHTLVVPEGVTSIGVSAFEGQGHLHTVVLPQSLTVLEDRAFFGCNRLIHVRDLQQTVRVGESVFTATLWEHTEQAHALGLGFQPPWPV